jgi:hypothetical protein
MSMLRFYVIYFQQLQLVRQKKSNYLFKLFAMYLTYPDFLIQNLEPPFSR